MMLILHSGKCTVLLKMCECVIIVSVALICMKDITLVSGRVYKTC